MPPRQEEFHDDYRDPFLRTTVTDCPDCELRHGALPIGKPRQEWFGLELEVARRHELIRRFPHKYEKHPAFPPFPPPPKHPEPRGPWPAEWEAEERKMIALINVRRSAGQQCVSGWKPSAPPLESHAALRAAARSHSLDVKRSGVRGHRSSDGGTLALRLSAANFYGGRVGENVAWFDSSAEGALATWLESNEGHCECLMNPGFRYVGIGHAHDLWTADFAEPPKSR